MSEAIAPPAPIEMQPVASEAAQVPAPEASFLEQKNSDVNTEQTEASVFAAPKAEERVIRSYVDEAGLPLADLNLLYQELNTKVEKGDDSNWNNLVQTVRDAEKHDAVNDKVDVSKAVKTFEAYASDKRSQLEKNKPASASVNTNEDAKTGVEEEDSQEQPKARYARILGKFGLGKSGAKVQEVTETAGDGINRDSWAYKRGYKKGQRLAAEQAREQSRPIDPLIAKQFDAEQEESANNDTLDADLEAAAKLRETELVKKYLESDPNNAEEADKLLNDIIKEASDEAEVQRMFAVLDEIVAADKAEKQAKLDAVASVETFKDVYADVVTEADKVTKEAVSRPEGFLGLTWTEDGVTKKVTGKTEEGVVITETYDNGQDRSNKTYSTDELLAMLKSDKAVDGFTWSE